MQVSNQESTGNGHPGAAAGIGKKMYYSISEVCAMTGIGQHILRYWEKEFSLLRPKKNSGGKRAYKEKDIEDIVKIKRMLGEEKYTLQGAKDKLSEERREQRAAINSVARKRGKVAVAGGEDNADLSASLSIDTDSELTMGENMPGNDNDGGVDKALIVSVREELLEILGLLET
jgi:DNA-binding transcriptional MerR regulator